MGFGLENTTINNNNHEQQQHAERSRGKLMMSNGSEFDQMENEAPFIIGRYM